MITFCGALNFSDGIKSFSELQKMRTERGAGCAFINGEYAVLCYGENGERAFLQPVTLKYNNAFYTAVIATGPETSGDECRIAESVLTGYLEEGETYLRRLDFGFALALYDQRCGELLLIKGGGEKSLFYTLREKEIFFSTSLACLMRLYGGCVRIDKNVLCEYIKGDYSPLPDGLFKDILSIKAGQGILCTRLGINEVYMSQATHQPVQEEECEVLEYSAKTDIMAAITDSLFAFGYPQFDFTMPSILKRIKEARAQGEGRICVEEIALTDNTRYFLERAESFYGTWGVELVGLRSEKKVANVRALRGMDRVLGGVLKDLLADSACVLHRLGADILENADEEKDLTLKIRKKAILCQCALWFEKFNVVLV